MNMIGEALPPLPPLTARHRFSIIQNFEQLALALKIFTALTCFLSFRIFEQLALVLKTEFALKCFTVLNILFIFRIFEQLALCVNSLY